MTADIYVDQYGRWPIDLCADNQLYILNGRTLGDLTGKFKVLTHLKPPRRICMIFFDVLPFTTLASSVNSKTSKKSMEKRRGGFRCVKTLTCHTPSGSSIVDYFITSSTLSTDIQSMIVIDLSLFSDHCMLTLKLKVSIELLNNDTINGRQSGRMQPNPIPDVFTWSQLSITKYQEAFNSSEIKMKIESFNILLKTGKAEDAEPLVESITDVMVTAGNLSLFQISYTNKRKRPKKVNKKRYDIDCQKLLREVKSSKKL